MVVLLYLFLILLVLLLTFLKNEKSHSSSLGMQAQLHKKTNYSFLSSLLTSYSLLLLVEKLKHQVSSFTRPLFRVFSLLSLSSLFSLFNLFSRDLT